MSWNIRAQAAARGDIAEALDAAIAGNPGDVERAGPHLEVARQAAMALVDPVTRPGDGVIVVLGGHHNPDCERVPGWADCTITVIVTQLPRTAE